MTNGTSMEIKKENGKFICQCSHGFKHPFSLQRHFKKCIGTDGVTMEEQNRVTAEEELMNCIGVYFRRLH